MKTKLALTPHVLAAFRNAALTIIRRPGYKGVEYFAEHCWAAVADVQGPRTE